MRMPSFPNRSFSSFPPALVSTEEPPSPPNKTIGSIVAVVMALFVVGAIYFVCQRVLCPQMKDDGETVANDFVPSVPLAFVPHPNSMSSSLPGGQS